MDLILASGSPRRKELLAMAGFAFKVMPADVDESFDPAAAPADIVAMLANKKAEHVYNGLKGQDALIIGADTIVVIDNEILGKPKDNADAFAMLMKLQGRAHTVYTGVAVISACDGKTSAFASSTQVFMRKLSEAEIKAYIATGEPMDKAGAYGIQEKGALLIEGVEGDYFTVVGLPICRLGLILKEYE